MSEQEEGNTLQVKPKSKLQEKLEAQCFEERIRRLEKQVEALPGQPRTERTGAHRLSQAQIKKTQH